MMTGKLMVSEAFQIPIRHMQIILHYARDITAAVKAVHFVVPYIIIPIISPWPHLSISAVLGGKFIYVCGKSSKTMDGMRDKD